MTFHFKPLNPDHQTAPHELTAQNDSADPVFGNDQTDTVPRGESGQASWAGSHAIDVKGRGATDIVRQKGPVDLFERRAHRAILRGAGMSRITNLAVATANDFGLAELVATSSAAMTNPDLHTLAVQAGDVLGAWGASLNLTRELTPVQTSADGKTLIDRAIYMEDGMGLANDNFKMRKAA